MKRVSTGVEGLDAMLNGGILAGKNILVVGPSGAGKTTLASHFLLKGCSEDVPCLYVTLEQPKKKVFEDLHQVNLPLGDEEGKYLTVIGGPIANITQQMKKVRATGYHIIDEIFEVVQKKKIKRVVLDSVNLLTMLSDHPTEKRHLLASLCNMLASNGCTTYLLSEQQQQTSEKTPPFDQFIADGVIHLEHLYKEAKFIAGVSIKKMRGTNHDRDIRPYKITDKGVVVFSKDVLFV